MANVTSSKLEPCLSAMPIHIKEAISQKTDISTKPRLRKCSKEYREYVDTFPAHYYSITLMLSEDVIEMNLVDAAGKEIRLYYQNCGNFCIVKEIDGRNRNYLPGGPHCQVDYAIGDLMTIFKNPKVSVDFFNIKDGSHTKIAPDNDDRFLTFQLLQEKLGSLEHKVKVKNFSLMFFAMERELLSVLSHLEPGTLRRIRFCTGCEPLNEAAETHQWKQAKHLVLKGMTEDVPIRHLLHFDDVQLDEANLTFAELKHMITCFKGRIELFERFEILTCNISETDRRDFENFLARFPTRAEQQGPIDKMIAVPGTREMLRILVIENSCLFLNPSKYVVRL